MLRFRNYHFVVAILLVWMATRPGYCSDVLYVDAPPGQHYAQQQVEAAARVYGLDVDVVLLSDSGDTTKAIAAINDSKTIAVVLTAGALQTADGDRILAAATRTGHEKPVMITGITEQTDPNALMKWSAGAISGSKRWGAGQNATYEVASESQITRQLSGSKLPLSEGSVPYLTFSQPTAAHWLIAAADGTNRYPVFAFATIGGGPVFFSTTFGAADANIPADQLGSPFIFPLLAPQLIFLQHAAGEHAWHSPGHYANLTIDDLWLREPYGYVDYNSLLREMEQHNFHTTIAFIPWNYDRSQAPVVALFRDHADRYSICIHGDNHDHQEFGPFDTKPLAGQITDMKQGLARMAAFQQQTNLPYDPVMVFPHKMSPQGTLANLKKYNYWATINAENIPSDATAPADPAFALRPATLAFADFPSVRRYSAEHPIPEWLLAMDAFLGNPIFFYCHQAFFADGIGTFNPLADEVNRLQPDTQWRSAGFIAQHLYLEKLRDDGNYDVQLLSATVSLTNDHGHDTVFFLDKLEDGAVPFKVTTDGQTQAYDFVNGHLRMQVPVRAGAASQIAVTYQNDLVLSKIDISKSSLRVAVLRHLSDFRDDVVTRSGPGRWFVRSYVANRSTWNHGAESSALLILLAALYWWRTAKRRHSPGHPGSVG
jgi:peptidoglycan/xylan/chitin deacetylase (PgdA/CDA1 family)